MKNFFKSALEPIRNFPFFFRALRRLWHPPQRIYRHLHFRGVIRVPAGEGVFRIRHHGFELENDLFWAGFGKGWEPMSSRLWFDLATRADFIADVGANTGVFALSAGAANSVARIVAVEADHAMHLLLEENIRLNRFDITTVERAASDRNGTATFYAPAEDHSYSASLERDMLGNLATRRIEVQTRRLDDILAELGFPRVDLVKLDVELHEPAALRGLSNMLQQHRPTLLVEVLNDEILREIREILTGLEYEFFGIDEAGMILVRDRPASSSRNMLICQTSVAQLLPVWVGYPPTASP